jgi:hypothetical protein
MIAELPVRLLWDGRVCIVRQDGIEVRLSWRPAVLSAMVVEMDYAPAVRVQELREMGCARRDMTVAEATAVHAWMALLITDVRAAAQRLAAGG